MEPELIDAPHRRERSRLACVYTLEGDPVPERLVAELARPDAHLALGRFENHFVGGGDATWPLHKAFTFVDAALATSRGTFATGASGDVYAAFVPYSGTVLLLVVDFDADAKAAVAILQETCFRRQKLTIAGKPLLDRFVGGLPEEVAKKLGPVTYGRDVHQLFMAGTRFAAELPAEEKNDDRSYLPDGYMRLVYREDTPFRAEPAAQAVMRFPAELNRPRGSLCAHGRGVTVLVGAAEHVEWGVVIGAIELLAALERMRRIRSAAAETLEDANAVGAERPGKARARLGELAQELGDLEVELSFGVVQYLDALRFPEIVLQSYRDSLAETLGIAGGAERTAALLGRLKTVLDARREELAAIDRRKTSLAVGYVTLVAVPLGALLAFLGANVHQVSTDYSAWDLGHYWPEYAILLGIVLGGAAVFVVIGLLRGRPARRKRAAKRGAAREPGQGGP
jgi:uncharacterized integral membrane protein